MANLGLIFITGLTNGGLSCLAVQGGMLASSIAVKTEDEMTDSLGSRGTEYERELLLLDCRELSKKTHAKALQRLKHHHPIQAIVMEGPKMPRLATPILLFLAAKLVAYTLLGFALGWLGSVL